MELQNGIYRARALGAMLGKAGTGAVQVGIEFELLDFEGQRISYFGTFGEKAREHTFKALRAAGWQGDDLSDLSSVGAAAPDVDLVVENEEWDGKVRPKVKWVNPAGSGGLTMKASLSPEEARAFAAQMKGALVAFDRTGGQRKPSSPASNGARGAPPEPPPHSDSDRPPF